MGKGKLKRADLSQLGMWEKQQYQISWEVLFYEEYKWRGRKEKWQNGSKVYVRYEKKRPGEFGKELDREGEMKE